MKLRFFGLAVLAALVVGFWTFRSDISALAAFARFWVDLKQTYVDELPSDQELVQAAVRGMVGAVDGCYVNPPPPPAEEQSGRVAAHFANRRSYSSGAQALHTDFGVLLTEVGDAWAFERGDVITAVSEWDLQNRSWTSLRGLSPYERDVLLACRYDSGVSVKVRRADGSQTIVSTHKLSLGCNETTPAFGRLLSKRIGYLRLCRFDGLAKSEFGSYLAALLSLGAEALILDLRDNSGGDAHVAMQIAGELFPPGTPIMAFSLKRGEHVGMAEGEGPPLDPHIPLVVLVNGNTASAAEILAGAIQDYKRGILVGEPTYGKGYGAMGRALPDGSVLWVKGLYWRTPLGRNINGLGLAPDILVPMTDERPRGIDHTDPQLGKAIECAVALLEGGVFVLVVRAPETPVTLSTNRFLTMQRPAP